MKSLLDGTEWKYNADEEDVAAFYLPASVMRSTAISCKAKVVWAYMNARPKGWDFSSQRIAKSMKESYQPIQRAMKELEDNGFLKRQRLADGRFSYELIVEPPVMSKEEGEACVRSMFPQSFVDDDFVCVAEAIETLKADHGLTAKGARESALDWQKQCQAAGLPQNTHTLEKWCGHVKRTA